VDVTFLTPFGALVALAVVVPLGVLLGRERRARRIRASLSLDEPRRLPAIATASAVAAIPLLLGLAAAQPVLDLTRTRPERTDAEIFVVLDTSRSMLASASPEAPTRYERAKDAFRTFRDRFGDVPIGLASITDRTLPHVFPTTDARVLATALDRSMGIERPPPAFFYTTHATTLGSLRVVPERNFFSPSARKRVLMVLTDGETREVGPLYARAFRRRPQIEALFVRFWDSGERIYETGIAEAGYKPDERSAASIERAADAVGGRVFEEDALDDAVDAAREFLGEGPTAARPREGEKLALMPYATGLALLPLAVVLRRRNFSG
jgi:hypothetical protein